MCNSIDSPLSDAKTHLPIMPSGTKHHWGVSKMSMTSPGVDSDWLGGLGALPRSEADPHRMRVYLTLRELGNAIIQQAF